MLTMRPDLIAPCGMNCALCVAYFGYTLGGKKSKIRCPGCRPRNKSCAFLKKGCRLLMKNEVRFCSDCNEFPCGRLKRLDDKYRARYNMSMIDNLDFIRSHGMKKFLDGQAMKYRCRTCGEALCVHTNKCYHCSAPK